MPGDEVAVFELAVPHHRPDPQAALGANVQPAEFGEPVQVYDDRRLGQTEVHDRDETLTTGQQFGIGSVLAHHLQGFRQRERGDIVEGSRFHKSDAKQADCESDGCR